MQFSRPWRTGAGAARRRREPGLGLPVAGAGCCRRAGAIVHADRIEPVGAVRVRQRIAFIRRQHAGSAPGARRVFDRRIGGGCRLALHRAVHGGVAGFRHWLAGRGSPRDIRRHRRGLVTTLSGGKLRAGICPVAATPRCLDGHLAQAAGFPHVRYGGLAGMGAWATKWHRRRRGPAVAAGRRGMADLGVDLARAIALAHGPGCWPGTGTAGMDGGAVPDPDRSRPGSKRQQRLGALGTRPG